ncbi:MAG TPA: metal-sulfur cluster assembly factor [Anaerolineaceae bacterium]|nr:metal-sulfur cluster assembly factor [Anaerolineaceae bacterium]HOV06403.1 metal-sulfur cluster assembly factor [Anaerolineaceae bacterium]
MTDNTNPTTNRPTWQAEESHPDLCERLRNTLSEVLDPELGLNVNQLGLIRDVTITDENAVIKMILTTPFCPYGPAMLESVREKAEKALEREVSIDFSLEPWDFSMMEEGLSSNWGFF